MEKSVEKFVTIDDTNIVAYLHYRGFRFDPYRKSGDTRVGFRVYYGPENTVDSALSDFYGNSKVGIQDYVGCLKKVRGSMFLIKGMEEHETETNKN